MKCEVINNTNAHGSQTVMPLMQCFFSNANRFFLHISQCGTTVFNIWAHHRNHICQFRRVQTSKASALKHTMTRDVGDQQFTSWTSVDIVSREHTSHAHPTKLFPPSLPWQHQRQLRVVRGSGGPFTLQHCFNKMSPQVPFILECTTASLWLCDCTVTVTLCTYVSCSQVFLSKF